MTPKPKILVILGPTASGKSDLAVRLAKKYHGEVVSADSRQVYKGLDIGSGKITTKEMKGIRHHLLDVTDPKKRFAVTEYQKLGEKAIADILNRGKLPIICGGTGFYIQALVDGIMLPEVEPNETLRNKLEKLTSDKLLVILKKLDPKHARTMSENNSDKNNPRRLIRAIEIATALGTVPSFKKSTKYTALFIGIKTETASLRERILKRLLTRLNNGMIEEVKLLHKKGLSWKRMEELGLEYRFVSLFLQKKIDSSTSSEQTKEDMVKKLFHAICQYSKRQMTWFNKDKRINWVNIGDTKKVDNLAEKSL